MLFPSRHFYFFLRRIVKIHKCTIQNNGIKVVPSSNMSFEFTLRVLSSLWVVPLVDINRLNKWKGDLD